MIRWGSKLGLAAVGAIVSVAGCVSEDQPSVHLVVTYQLRGVTGGVRDENSVDNLDGLAGFKISCEIGGETEDIGFSAVYDDDSRLIELDSSSETTKDGEKKCSFTVKEDNTYQRDCVVKKSKTVDCNNDTIDAPCRVAIVEQKGSTVRGLICCKALPIQGKQPKEGDYSIFAPGSGDKPVSFAVYNCEKK